MAAPRRTRALARLWADFDTAFPNRDRASDGWIGDEAHQQNVSGHNPDDTPGSRSEYTDGDTIAEVRAIDVDDDLRGTATMDQVIARILATPSDRARLKYVIYNRRIWSRSTGTWAAYSGANPHDRHAHFSGDPATDDDDRPWAVAQMGVKAMNVDDVWGKEQEQGDGKKYTVLTMVANVAELLRRGGWKDWWIYTAVEELRAGVKALKQQQTPQIDHQQLAVEIVAELFRQTSLSRDDTAAGTTTKTAASTAKSAGATK